MCLPVYLSLNQCLMLTCVCLFLFKGVGQRYDNSGYDTSMYSDYFGTGNEYSNSHVGVNYTDNFQGDTYGAVFSGMAQSQPGNQPSTMANNTFQGTSYY